MFSKTPIYFFLALSFFFSIKAFGYQSNQLDWFGTITGLFGGLALFLYGMEKLSKGLQKSTGKYFVKALTFLSKNRFIGLLTGILITSLVQSSSATTVLLVSFVQSGLMQFKQTVAIIMGSNIGSTFTMQIIAFKVTDYAVVMLTIGFMLKLLSKKESLKYFGDTLFGFGLLFFGMKLMSLSMAPFKDYQPFLDILKTLENPIYSLLTGLIFTSIIQSSGSFSGIVVVLAQQGLITLESGFPMIMGANIGTCVTALLASYNTNREAKNVALAHTLFNIGGVIIFSFWLSSFIQFNKTIALVYSFDIARQIANAHTIFNILTTLLFLPFSSFIAYIITKLFPEEKTNQMTRPVIKHLDESVIKHIPLAISLSKSEINSMLKILSSMIENILVPFLKKEIPRDKKYAGYNLIQGLDIREKKIDFLEAKVSQYLIQIAKQELNHQQSKEITSLLSIANDIERIGDIVYDHITPLIKKKELLREDFSEEGKEELIHYHEKVIKQMKRVKEAFNSKEIEQINTILIKSEKYFELEETYKKHHFERMNLKESSIQTHRIHMELIDYLKQINVYLDNIARVLLSMTKG